ncbi:MAG: serine O-acetyltransferase [Myxococcota bacterium]|nr:serine O-acetyltransferase [Myxococcota bacterium]
MKKTDVPRLWSEIRRCAELESAQEPLLRDCITRRVLAQATFADAIGYAIVRGLENEDLSQPVLTELTRHVLESRPAVAMAAACDVEAYVARDPACESVLSPLLHYKGFLAIQCYRIANALWVEGRRTLARFLQARIAQAFAIDIHPAAQIGSALFVDHGTGIVVGETSVVADNVSMLHAVTLGGTGKVGGVRHPKIGEGVLLGAGATVLGNVEVGVGSKVAAGSVVLQSVPAHCTVAGVPAQPVGHPSVDQPSLEMSQDIDS